MERYYNYKNGEKKMHANANGDRVKRVCVYYVA